MYMNHVALRTIEESIFLLEEFSLKKNKKIKWRGIKLPENKVKLIAEDAGAKQLTKNPKFVKQVRDYLGMGYYDTEEKKEKVLKEEIKIYMNIKEATDDVKIGIEYTNNFPKNKKEQDKIFKVFLDRFVPFYPYGNGDYLVWDKKQQKLVDLTHEEGDYKKIVLELNSSKIVKWI